MHKLLLSGFFLLLVLPGPAQNFIGRKAEEIRKYMTTEQNNFSLDETTVNKVYKYLKYVDEMETRTALYFLSDDDVCTWYKVVYDNDLLPSVIAGLDSTCRKVSDTLWLEKSGENTCQKILKRQDWFFTVITKPVEQDTVKQ
ncbi:MAG TPA: hypothetical protein ENK25_00030 [Bacteroidetes bacterium]|nr:hypothetical protein [Bacteroidota bacterium]